jgi:hypothetical protein
MNKAYKYEQHLLALLAEEKQCFQDGDWERLDRIRLAIDDTNEQIAQAKTAKTNTWKHDASFNSQFLGAKPARAGQDY